jgi:hypothetical protein
MRSSELQQQIDEILTSPSYSYWLKNALRTVLERDPVDASTDVGILNAILDQVANEVFANGVL